MESKVLYQWLKDHPLINLNGLCKMVKFDRANLIKNMKSGKELKPEVFTKFWQVLGDYGFMKIVKIESNIQELKIDDTHFSNNALKTNHTINTIKRYNYSQMPKGLTFIQQIAWKETTRKEQDAR